MSENEPNTQSVGEFPPLKNDTIIRAARGETTQRVPVWIMRQAGRYLPEFREMREKHSFFEICRTPELACEVTLQPLKRFDLDAAIIFADILVIPQALGMEVEMRKGVGPVLPNPVSTFADLNNLKSPREAIKELDYVSKAITLTRHKLEGKVPLIGFAGAPWTVMCYMIEGGGSKTMSKAKGCLYSKYEFSVKLLQMITDLTVLYLVEQVKAGAQLLQLFESNAEYLTPEMFHNLPLFYIKSVREGVEKGIMKENLPKVPMMIFAKGSHSVLSSLSTAKFDVISVDWTITPKEARNKVSKDTTLQGNLDPCALMADPVEIKQMVYTMLKGFGHQRYIANLGHGIYPEINPDNVKVFVNAVHEYSESK